MKKQPEKLKIGKLKKPFIFVTLGTGPYQFDRLLKILDDMMSKKKSKIKKFKYNIIAQIGSSTYTPKNYEYFRFSSNDERNYLMSNASIIINHGGAGSIIDSFMHKKPTIIFPRQVKFGEHINDSSVSLAMMFERRGLASAAFDAEDLKKAIENAGKLKARYERVSKLSERINKYLENLKSV